MKPVLISGAGLSGLLLARSLRYSNIPFLLYERDASILARAQGYRIRISKDGLDALTEVLSPGDFEKFKAGTANTSGGKGGIQSLDAITGLAKPPESYIGSNGKSKGPGLGGDVLGVARGFLRQCLFEGMEDMVHWGKQSVAYSSSDSGVVLSFTDDTKSPEGSMLVAADGPHSPIVKQLTDGKIRSYDTGARMIHGQTPAESFEQLGEGVFMIQDESRPEGKLGLITNVRPTNGEKNVEYGWVFVGGQDTFTAPGDNFSLVGKVAADLSRDLTSNWNPKFQTILQDQNDAEAAFLKMSTAWPDGIPEYSNPDPRVTMMGDAVHCMTPAGGVGANTALKDAAFLGRLLGRDEGWQEGVTEEYEQGMRVYASENVKMSFEAAAKMFSITDLK